MLSMICGISALINTFSSNCANFFSCSYCWKSFSWFQERWVNILDGSRPATGKGGASHEVSAQASRKLGRNQWSWSWEYQSQKKQQEESTGIQMQVFMKAAGNWDIQNNSVSFCQWGKRIILISEWTWCEEQGFTLMRKHEHSSNKRGVCRKDRLHVNHERDSVGTWNDPERLTWRIMGV